MAGNNGTLFDTSPFFFKSSELQTHNVKLQYTKAPKQGLLKILRSFYLHFELSVKEKKSKLLMVMEFLLHKTDPHNNTDSMETIKGL